MDKDPKTPLDEQGDVTKIRIDSVPLMVFIAGVLSTVDFVNWIFIIAEMLVVFVLTYQILGRALFTALVVTPCLVVFISNCLAAYDEIIFGDDGSSDDDDSHLMG